jgi:hypothetical protein
LVFIFSSNAGGPWLTSSGPPRKKEEEMPKIGEIIWNALGQRDLFGKP